MTNPIYPIYIPSKGRYESMITSKSLTRMKVPHNIVVEPQEFDDYKKAVKIFNLENYATVLELPFSNLGLGSYPARNWAWDHSKSIGAKKHWCIDDNISDFYRLNKNFRIRVESGIIFKIAEDFVDRYDNVPVSGFNYRFFIAPNTKYPPYYLNTKVYSTILIQNDCPYRWRLKYNEDVDLCLQVLKAGYCTIQFNAFLAGKCATQTVDGGNTGELYGKKGNVKDPKGTLQKSQMLVDYHPDVAKVVWKYNRVHHYVDYRPFKKNKLKYKDGFIKPKNIINNYGMKLITNFKNTI
jgi:hypothetical protein